MFELLTVTKVTWTNVNPRPELHGDEHVRAIDLSFRIDGSNELLDDIEQGLLLHHYTNRAAKAGQAPLPDTHVTLPNLRFAKLPTVYRYAEEDKPRGYVLEIDWGLGDRNVVLEDCVRGTLRYETIEGGSLKVDVTMQYNGSKLEDNALYGRLCGLAGEGEGHILLRAPMQQILVKGKGWRSGKADTPPLKDGGTSLPFHVDPDADTERDVVTPEKALAATEGRGRGKGGLRAAT